MPFYKLICKQCGQAFEQRASISDRTESRISCPACGGQEMETDYSSGSAAVISPASGGAPACPHAAQCGCGCARGRAH